MKFFSDEIHHLMEEFDETKKALHEARLELQKKVEELETTNTRLGESQSELQQKVEDLNRNETAMLNVLEDARELEKNLKRERDLTKAVISSMGEGLLVAGRDHKVILMNQAASIMLRIAPEEAENNLIEHVFHLFQGNANNQEEYQLPIDNLLKEPNIITLNLEDSFYCKDKDGNTFPIAVIMASLLKTSYSGENISGAVVIFRNITKEKSLDEAKSGFISIASHQLRTPLTSIRWFSEMLLDGDAGGISEEQKHFVERIYQGTDRMINLVNLLLQIARVEAGRVKIDPVPIDLKLLTEGVIMTLRTQLDEKKQKIEITTLPAELPKIPIDEDVAWQIVQNLLTNALRYSYEGGVVDVKIEVRQEAKEIIYSVRDHGIGIPQEEQNRIFEKFFRADNALQHAPEGSGLGLNLVKKLVDDWEGKIWFDSEVGKGTTFFFTIPLKGMKARQGEVKLKV